MPWKNGGGTTIEMHVEPALASIDTFDLRISMAEVAQTGPFSMFKGIDRTLTILGGSGLRLQLPSSETRDLDPSSPPIRFAGDVAVKGGPISGSTTDLNVMTRRAVCDHRVERVSVGDARAVARGHGSVGVFLSDHQAVRISSGSIGSVELTQYDLAIIEPVDGEGFILSSDAPTRVLLMWWHRLAPQ